VDRWHPQEACLRWTGGQVEGQAVVLSSTFRKFSLKISHMREERDKQANLKDRFISLIQRDPYIIAIITALKLEGMDALTNEGTAIYMMHNRTTGITIIVDPARPSILIKSPEDEKPTEFPVKLAIKWTMEKFGFPTSEHIPKYGTNIAELQNALNKLRSFL
jgi:hypothetical protein